MSSGPAPESVADFHSLEMMINHLNLDEAKSLLMTAESLQHRFTMQQTLLASVGAVLGGSWLSSRSSISRTSISDEHDDDEGDNRTSMRRDSLNSAPSRVKVSFEADAPPSANSYTHGA